MYDTNSPKENTRHKTNKNNFFTFIPPFFHITLWKK